MIEKAMIKMKNHKENQIQEILIIILKIITLATKIWERAKINKYKGIHIKIEITSILKVY